MKQTEPTDTGVPTAATMKRILLTRTETAALLRVSAVTLWKWHKRGYLIPIKIGGRVLYPAADIDRIIERKGGNNGL